METITNSSQNRNQIWDGIWEKSILKARKGCPGRVAQLVGASSLYAKVAGSVPTQGTYKNQPKNWRISEIANRCVSLSLSLSLSLKNIYKF